MILTLAHIFLGVVHGYFAIYHFDYIAGLISESITQSEPEIIVLCACNPKIDEEKTE